MAMRCGNQTMWWQDYQRWKESHQLPFSRNSRSHDKRVIVKFTIWKNMEALLKDKKQISGKNFGYLHATNKVFLYVSFCTYYQTIDISGVNVRISKGKAQNIPPPPPHWQKGGVGLKKNVAVGARFPKLRGDLTIRGGWILRGAGGAKF